MGIRETAMIMKQEAPLMAFRSGEEKNNALRAVAEALRGQKEEIFRANKEDLERAEKEGVPVQIRKRLAMDAKKLEGVCDGIEALISLPDPVGKVSLHRELDKGLVLRRISCPIGVIGVIFEARPDALVQISSLCIKSGNTAILIPEHFLELAQTHSEIDELLKCDREVDLLIPRGSNRFVRYIMEHTNIPVMGHSDGICHIYVDRKADPEIALQVITDAKTQYPVACNTVETVLADREIADTFLPLLAGAMKRAGVRIHADDETLEILRRGCPEETAAEFIRIEEADYHTEYGDLDLSVKVVEDTARAAEHINRYGSHHTDAIITEDDAAAAFFMRMVDSAGVYRNVSTRFADGFRYGFGAEVGISTGKLHARGPVGLEGLVTYKYELTGNGQIVGDYASGRSSFHFREIDI